MKNNNDGTKGVDLWVARNKNGSLFLHVDQKPYKEGNWWELGFSDYYFNLDPNLFPEVKWSDDEPTKVKLVIDKN